MSDNKAGQPSTAPSSSKSATTSSATKTSLNVNTRPNMPRQRSRGQLARRNSITRSAERAGSTKQNLQDEQKQHRQNKQQQRLRHKRGVSLADTASSGRARMVSTGAGGGGERPWLGGLYFTDIVFIGFTYSVNLLRTLGLAEIADVMIKGLIYALTQLPFDLYNRWSLSTPPLDTTPTSRKTAAKIRRRRRRAEKEEPGQTSSSESDPFESLTMQPRIFASSREDGPETTVVEQLSPFHHLVILLSKFACGNFPHLLPRVLFAEETIGPFVYWRTGGGSNAMVQEFTDLNERRIPLLQVGKDSYTPAAKHPATDGLEAGSFRAYMLSKDARLPIDVQRANLAARRATTLLYLHGGGFSLGSVAFYAEALLRLRAKVALLESDEPYDVDNPIAEARCVAVEYDLSPAARFPLPLLQCLRCYAHLIEVEKVDAESICIAGDSAGGNLAMGMLLCLDGQMRDEPMLAERDWSKLPMPGKAVLISPWVDLRPKNAHAFANIRKQSADASAAAGFSPTRKKRAEAESVLAEKARAAASKDTPQGSANAWTEAVGKYEWDYVASESLLHFAQVYAGVLPLPRRVYGPLGWIAHICGVLALQYDDVTDDDESEEVTSTKTARPTSKSFMDPSRALSVFSRPSRRLARAAQQALSDPLLPRLLGLNVREPAESDAVTRADSITAGFEALFTPSERRTDVVANTGQLYETIDGPLSATGADKIGVDHQATQARLRGRHLLDTHPLLSPATGDWSRIKLKHGCLVSWGERERMADDIEAWVDSLVNMNSGQGDTNAPPAPDRPAHPSNDAPTGDTDPLSVDDNDAKRTSHAQDGEEWVYTAVEKGPGGVHAWPFVSMYLAGSEAERERGLDLLARFVARSHPEADDGTHGDTFLHVGLDLPDSRGAEQDVDPPHAAPFSDDSDDNSVGSMPSDVDLHGLVDDPTPDSFGDFGTVNIADAVRRAQELGFVQTETEDGEMTPSSESSAARLTPRPSARTVRIASPPISPPPAIAYRPEPTLQARPSSHDGGQVERGRSRSPREIVHLVSPTSRRTVDPSHFVSPVQLHRPQSVTAQPQQAQQQGRSAESASPQKVVPLWWTSGDVVSRAAGPSEKAEEIAPEADGSPAILTPTNERWTADDSAEDDQSRHELEDILEVSSEEAMSPARSVSPLTSPQTQLLRESNPSSPSDDEVEDTPAMNLSVNIDPSGLFAAGGLGRWAIQRPEPEGLSDIAEEGSVLSASVTSAGDEDRSRSLSPSGHGQTLRGAHEQQQFSSPSLTEAATQFMQSQPRQASGDATAIAPAGRQWRFLRDEIGMRRAPMEEEGEEDDDDDDDDEDADEEGIEGAGGRAFSPPAKPQPGRSLPVVTTRAGDADSIKTATGEGGSEEDDSVEAGPSGALGIKPRKKPKGDVWW